MNLFSTALRATRGLLSVLAAASLMACAATVADPHAGDASDADSSTGVPPSGAEVLGRSDRFVVVQPAPDDTLRSIAARFLGSEDRDWVIGDFNGVRRADPGQPLVVPLKNLNPIGVHGDRIQTVPILCYHRFGNGGSKMAVSAASFAAQLEWLARNDYHVIRLSQLLDFLEGRQALPRRSVVITIDDGYESVHRYALPLLRKYGFPATLFVYTDFIGAGDALSWAQLQDLAASGLVDIEAHSKSHRNLIERLAQETDSQYRQGIEGEVRVPRELLEKRLAVRVRHYAFPYGDANDTVLEVLARQQYTLAVTVNPGGNAFYAQPLMLHRTMIFGDHDLAAFKSRLQVSRPFSSP